jgi:hypothetical protein
MPNVRPKGKKDTTKMIKILIIILIAAVPLVAYSQKNMSKQEVYSYLVKNEKKTNNIDSYKKLFDAAVVNIIDTLKKSGIDTLGVYAAYSVGYMTSDTCECGIVPWAAYVEWIYNGKAFYKKVTKCCNGVSLNIESSVLIGYYVNNKKLIDNEKIMPVITGALKKRNGKVIFDMITVDHTIHYLMYCDLNGIIKFVSFEQFYLENEKGLYFRENNDSKINSWRIMTGNQIKELIRK